jgi:hypothetical protein
MIEHLLRDDWRDFLDRSQLFETNTHVNGKPSAGHLLYSPMLKRKGIFLHRSPLNPVEYEYYTRCIKRFRALATDPTERALLVHVQSSSHRSRHSIWVHQFYSLFECLDGYWEGAFELLVIRLQKRKAGKEVTKLKQIAKKGYPSNGLRPPADEAGADAGARADAGADDCASPLPGVADEVECRHSGANVMRVVYLQCWANEVVNGGASFNDPRDFEAFCACVEGTRDLGPRAQRLAGSDSELSKKRGKNKPSDI